MTKVKLSQRLVYVRDALARLNSDIKDGLFAEADGDLNNFRTSIENLLQSADNNYKREFYEFVLGNIIPEYEENFRVEQGAQR